MSSPHLKVPVSASDHSQGPDTAPVTLVEYGDYQCPYCGAAFPVVKALQAKFGDKLRFVFRNFPLANLHAHAVSAATVAEFAAAHEKFWEVHDALFENQQQLGGALYGALADKFGLSRADLEKALETNAYEKRLEDDFNGGASSGVNGTPSFFINGQRYDGAAELKPMADAISRAIAGA